MSLTLFDSEPLFSLADFNRLFDDAFNARTNFGGLSALANRQHDDAAVRPMRPRMDLHEDPENNLVTATFELPGLTKGNVHLDVKEGVLSISGESTSSTEHDENGYAVRERRFGKFFRALQLP